VKNDSVYWANVRPIPLTPAEKVSLNQKGEYLKKIPKPEFQDSVRDSKRKFKLKHLVFGNTYNYSTDSLKKDRRFSVPGLLDPTLLAFNSVDGFRLELPFSYTKSDSTGRFTRLHPVFAYAFARQKLDAGFSIDHRLNGMKNSLIGLSLGTTTCDYNRVSGLPSMTNDFYTLWMEENFNRYYRRDYVRISAGSDLANGLNLTASADYSNNIQLSNHSHYSFIKYARREIQPNVPVNDVLEDWQLQDHRSLIGRISLEYTPRHRYLVRNQAKIYVKSNFPTWTIDYQQAFPAVFETDSRFSLLKIGMRQMIGLGIDDHISYRLNVGRFIQSRVVYFEDFQHFNVKSTGFMFSSYENSFRLLPFYAYSTNSRFAEVHTNWQSRRLIIKQLPVVRNSAVSENLFLNVLSTPELKTYFETGYGLKNLFLLLNVEGVAGFEAGKFRSAGVRVSLNLK
jgi:hypothetical protein